MRPLTSDLYVSPQVTLENIKAAADAGIKTIICNRPENEEPAQLPFTTIEQEAESQGIKAMAIPVRVGQITNAQVAAFNRALEASPKPALAYCRSGMRATMLWALGQSGSRSFANVSVMASKAGYDIASLADQFASSKAA